MDLIAINAAYALSALALALRGVLRLRIVLLAAQGTFLTWGILVDALPAIAWNSLFMLINTAMIARILWERRAVEIPAAIRDLHGALFPALSPREFLLLWEMGNPRRLTDAALVAEGEMPSAVSLLLDGQAQVRRGGKPLARMGRGEFIAEMSFVTGEPASADVLADGTVSIVSWSRRKLDSLEMIHPRLFLQFHKALGRDLSRKAVATGAASPAGVAVQGAAS
ncbi:MAG TPA: cyclic nucleotide-binding domain-containing protein [Pseudomonadales bacterium]|nr:cyclic nucleotide-binding domain-containing protein [Pseudomonadales bacterium]